MTTKDLTFDERVQMYMQSSREDLLNLINRRESDSTKNVYIGDAISDLIENEVIPDIEGDGQNVEYLTDEHLATILATHDVMEFDYVGEEEDSDEEDCSDCDCCCEDCECGLSGCNCPTETDPEEHNLITDTINCLKCYNDMLIDLYDSDIEDENNYNKEIAEEVEFVRTLVETWEDINKD